MRKEKLDPITSIPSGLEAVGEDSSSPGTLYSQLREKDRLLREYKFKYETTKILYEELLSVLIVQAEKPVLETSSRQGLLQACQYVDEELSALHIKRPDINRIKLSLMDRIERTFFPKLKSTSSFVSSSPKLERPNSQVVSQTGKYSSTNNSMNSETLISLGHREKESDTDYFRRSIRKLPGRVEGLEIQPGNALASFKEYLITKKLGQAEGLKPSGVPSVGRSRGVELEGSSRGSRHSSRGHTPRVPALK